MEEGLRAHHNKIWLEAVARCVFALCLSLALCMDMGIPGPVDSRALSKPELFWHIMGLTGKGVLVTLLFFLLLGVSWKIDGKKTERRISFLIANAFIGLIWLMGEGFRVDDTLWTLHASYFQILKSFVYFVGITYGLNQITYLLYGALEKKEAKSLWEGVSTSQNAWCSRIVKAYREHTGLVSFGAVFTLWLPHLIFAYPASVYRDTAIQLLQYFGAMDYSNHHPIVYTVIVGSLVKAGSLISVDFGLFFCVALQAVIGACILAYTLCLMRELNSPVWLRTLAFACYISVPYYTNYITIILKDVAYSYAMLLCVVELIYLLLRGEDFFQSKRHILLLAISIVGIILFRNNGRYVIYPTIAAMLLFFFFHNQKSEKGPKARRRILPRLMAEFLIPALLAEVFFASVMSILHVKPGSAGDAFSLPVQQTARYVKEFGDEVTEEEKAAISAVLEYENLAENYDPSISDPVKNTFKYSPTMGELRDYLSVWLKQFVKHPFVYFKATVNQNYYLLYPGIPNNYISVHYLPNDLLSEIGLEIDNAAFANMADLLRAFYMMCFYFPGLNLLSHPAFYVTLLIWLTLFALCRKRFLWILLSVPIWLSAAIIVLAPVILGTPRYIFPVIYAMPTVLAYYIYQGRAEETKNKIATVADPPSA